MDIKRAEKTDFDLVFSEIEKNFIPDERRDYDDALKLFLSGKYEIILFISEGKNVGFITLWHFEGFTFAEHFVIYEKYRNAGLGALALKRLEEVYTKIVLEAEPPISPIAERRLAFYKRNGFFENGQKYMQPAYREDKDEVELLIMSYPSLLDNFAETVSIIKREVYGKK